MDTIQHEGDKIMTEFSFLFFGNYSFKCACVEHTTVLTCEFMGVDSFYIKLL